MGSTKFQRLCLVFIAAAVLGLAAPSVGVETYDYSRIDAHALAATDKDEKSIPALAKYLSSGARNDREKARAIFRWLTDRIAYDVEGYLRNRIPASSTEAKGVLRTRKGVCEGYSDLFYELGVRSGLEVVKILGFAKGYSYLGVDTGRTNHVWTGVKIDGQWRLIDSTWGAGNVTDDGKFQKELEEFFFFTPPEHLIYTHLPEDPQWQLIPTPVSREEFIKLVNFKPGFFELGLEPVTHKYGVINSGASLEMKFTCPPDVFVYTRMARGGAQVSQSLAKTVRTEDGITVMIEFAEPGDYYLTLSGKKGRETNERRHLVEYRIIADKGAGDDAGFAETTDDFESMGMQLISHLKPLIKTGAELEVVLGAPQDVFILVRLEQNGKSLPDSLTRWFRRDDSIIIQCQFPGPGEYRLSVFAKRGTEGNSYTGVLTYNIRASQGLGETAGFVQTTKPFADLGLEVISPERPLIITDSDITVELKAPPGVITLVRVTRDGKDQRDNLTRVRREGERLFIDAQFPDPGRYKLTLFAKPASDPGSYNQMLSYEVEVKKGAGDTAGFAKTSQKFDEYGLQLASHEGAVIVTGEQLTITVRAPEDVFLMANLAKDGKQLGSGSVKTNRAGELISLDFTFPSPGVYTVQIFARRGDNSGSFDYVLEYEVRVK